MCELCDSVATVGNLCADCAYWCDGNLDTNTNVED